MRKPAGRIAAARALAERDLAGRLSYRFTFVFELVGLGFIFAALFFAGKMVPRSAIGGHDYFTLTLIGMGAQILLVQISTAPRTFLSNELGTGVLETMLTAGPRLEVLLDAAAICSALRGLIRLLVVIVIVKLAGENVAVISAVPRLLPLFLLAVLCALGSGYLQAGLELRTRRSTRFMGIFRRGGLVFTGIYFPVAFLPEPLQYVAACIPTTHVVAAARAAFLTDSVPVREYGFLLAMGLVLFAAGRATLRNGLEIMFRDGTYLRY